jgi:bacterioferritin-associated ferredoxin
MISVRYGPDRISLLNVTIIRLGFLKARVGRESKRERVMIVCHCRGITDREVRRCVRSGAHSVRGVSEACGASTGCGGCRPAVRQIVESELETEGRHSLPLLQAAALIG